MKLEKQNKFQIYRAEIIFCVVFFLILSFFVVNINKCRLLEKQHKTVGYETSFETKFQSKIYPENYFGAKNWRKKIY